MRKQEVLIFGRNELFTLLDRALDAEIPDEWVIGDMKDCGQYIHIMLQPSDAKAMSMPFMNET